ncbi:peptidoglycan-binding domain-containing protein [Leekyejoonella antrihumi]|uniref:Peptidoglycan-binding protein n=1 Tax=Leekyejoonella antrihumi TaxID=1660198 RepID=A0A563EB42_9MICO|nr:peptidoglycan-binding domain-containing protein [Leekyejoonella antrihumi]TWP39004.1 peptidoglycan-binding protein [Leekyejoonella antrihumi]
MKMIGKQAAVCAAALATMAGGALAIAPGANAAPATHVAIAPANHPVGDNPCGYTQSWPWVGYHYVTSGNAVKEVQCKLKLFGYSIGYTGIDGIFGTNTYTAVVRFQHANGLYADGIVGANTWRALGW